MQTLFLAAWFPEPADNGSKIRVNHLLRALAEKHDVTLLSFAFGGTKPKAVSRLHEICAHIGIVPVDPFAINSGNDLEGFLSPAPLYTRPVAAMSRLVHETMAANHFDVVIASTATMATYALQSPAAKALLMLEEHNCMTRWMWERYQVQRGALQRLRCGISWYKTRRFEARLFKQFDLVSMVSEQDRAVCQDLLPQDGRLAALVPNGVDCRHNQPGLIERQDTALVYNGALTYDANFDAMQYFLSAVYPLIKAQVPLVSLKITGSTKGVATELLALDPSVELTGFVDDIRLPVAEATVCVAPIRQGGGTRLKILEAMALGTPVVTSKKGAEGLNVVNGRHLLIADTPAAFAHSTLKLLHDAELRRYLALNARRLVVEQYDWRQIGGQFTVLIEDAADKNKVENHEVSNAFR